MEISNKISTTPTPFKFVLTANGKDVVCNQPPIGWDSGEMAVSRRMETGGVTQSFMVDSLTFVGNGAAFIKSEFEEREGNGEMGLKVYEFKPLQMDYVPFASDYKIIFNSYKTVKVGEFTVGVTVDLLSNGRIQKYDDRKTVKIDLTNNETIGEMTLNDLSGFPEYSRVFIQEMKEYLRASSTLNDFNDEIILQNSSVPANSFNSDFAETPESIEYYESMDSDKTLFPAFFESSNEDRTVNVKLYIKVNVTDKKNTGDMPFIIWVEKFNSDNESLGRDEIWAFGKEEGVIEHETPTGLNIALQEGDTLKMYIGREREGQFENWEAFLLDASIKIEQEVINTPDTIVEGLPIFDALKRASQKVLDDEQAFYSDFFGRTDLDYSSENDLRFAHVMSGLHLRGLDFTEPDGGINTTLEEILQTVANIWCTGHSIEFIEDRFKLRVENYSYFFNNTVIFDLTDRVNELDIETEYMSGICYVELLTGYENYIYQSTSGRSEYNTEQTRSTRLNNPNKLDLKSAYRADTTGMANCLEMPLSDTNSEDISEDSDVFILKTQRIDESNYKWVAEKQENIIIENNSSLFGDSSLNLYFTPARNLFRNTDRFLAGLQVIPESKIKHQTSNKYQNLETTGEGYTIIEDEDKRVDEFATPLFRPIKHKFECYFTNDEMRTLNERGADGVMNYLKSVKFGDKYGYILDVKKALNEDKAAFELIERL